MVKKKTEMVKACWVALAGQDHWPTWHLLDCTKVPDRKYLLKEVKRVTCASSNNGEFDRSGSICSKADLPLASVNAKMKTHQRYKKE